MSGRAVGLFTVWLTYCQSRVVIITANEGDFVDDFATSVTIKIN